MNKITVNRGTTYAITGTYTDSDGNTDITGATVRFTVKSGKWSADEADSDALITATGSLTNATAGQYTIDLSNSDTEVTPGKYYYDIKIELQDGSIYRLDFGRFIVSGSPTNRTS